MPDNCIRELHRAKNVNNWFWSKRNGCDLRQLEIFQKEVVKFLSETRSFLAELVRSRSDRFGFRCSARVGFEAGIVFGFCERCAMLERVYPRHLSPIFCAARRGGI
ncbi:hypothetical protein Zmor_009516 [Zophobas morio]|uniref:Uncharacterized protein n=1 Tax=Zophobas morio TaxID=2755281 RepID=A0AA38IPD3_9CUCU|nr:hypothetical protein Zmor_009516 [Zophobas morio]